jgi:ParB/RepB/Spo0J family partition protein
MPTQVHVLEIPIDDLMISPLNVRKELGDIAELTDSIREEGVLQPLLVRPHNGKYEIIAGSRRYSAASRAGLDVLPAVVRELTDAQAVAASLTENMLRGDLSLEERVGGYHRLQELDPEGCGTVRGLARLLGRSPVKVTQDMEAYDALVRLRPRGIDVVSQLPPGSEARRKGEALPERHAVILEQAFGAVKELGAFEDEEDAEARYVELARHIAPLDQDDAKKVLDYFKMYPERSVEQLAAMALTQVDREVSLDPVTARKLDELAQASGQRWEQVITSLVENVNQGPAMIAGQYSLPETGAAAPAYDNLDFPEAPLGEQILNKTLWNVEQAQKAGLHWDFFTIGTSQKTLGQLVEALQRCGVATVIDIRHDATSAYNPEFDADNLARTLKDSKIAYLHLPDLGVPRLLSSQLARDADWQGLFRWYDTNVIPKLRTELLNRIKAGMREPVAFLTGELDPTRSHRHRVSLALAQMGLKGADL